MIKNFINRKNYLKTLQYLFDLIGNLNVTQKKKFRRKLNSKFRKAGYNPLTKEEFTRIFHNMLLYFSIFHEQLILTSVLKDTVTRIFFTSTKVPIDDSEKAIISDLFYK
jgi:hypothetical protein